MLICAALSSGHRSLTPSSKEVRNFLLSTTNETRYALNQRFLTALHVQMIRSACSLRLIAVADIWALLMPTAAASPFDTRAILIADRGDAVGNRSHPPRTAAPGESSTHRTLFLAGSLICIALLAGILGTRYPRVPSNII